jgi:hypothetical protein
MRFLILDTYYNAFLSTLYAEQPDLANRPYAEQLRTLMDRCFGIADFYSSNLKLLGHEATEIVVNCEPLQRQWAREHGAAFRGDKSTLQKWRNLFQGRKHLPSSDWFEKVLIAQVQEYCPDILFIQNMHVVTSALMQAIRPYVRLIAGQIASSISPSINFREYDLVLSALPSYVKQFQAQGVDSRLFRLGFEASILTKLGKAVDSYPVVHVGGYGPVHEERNQLLETLITLGVPLSCWGYAVHSLSAASPIRSCYRGEAWGLEMYNIRHSADIVVTKHISSVASVHAANMTMYETTGIGALLVVDQKNDLSDLFEPGREVIVYHSAEECAELILYYLKHQAERKTVARAGQARTLRDHTYFNRMQELVDIVTPLLGNKPKNR